MNSSSPRRQPQFSESSQSSNQPANPNTASTKPSYLGYNRQFSEEIVVEPAVETNANTVDKAPQKQNTAAVIQKLHENTEIVVSKTNIPVRHQHTLYATQTFYEDAARELILATQGGVETSGAVLVEDRGFGKNPLLVGLQRMTSGKTGNVPVEPSWGSVLWHTHPGLRGSLAAFSSQDLEASRLANRPLLVVGFSGLSLDVLSTLLFPFGKKGMILGASIKGLLSLDKRGRLNQAETARLLAHGVVARVCYPDGTIYAVCRAEASPWQAAVDDMAFTVDSAVGAVERVGQKALLRTARGALRALDRLRRL